MPDQLDELDYYTLLGVSPEATEQEIRRAFRRFARKYHPDRYAAASAEKRERATHIYRRGAEGLQVLCDAAARELYDLALDRGILRLTAAQRDGAARILARKEGGPKKAGIRSTHARAFYEKGVRAMEAGRYREAWKALSAALREEPDNPLIARRLDEVGAALRRP